MFVLGVGKLFPSGLFYMFMFLGICGVCDVWCLTPLSFLMSVWVYGRKKIGLLGLLGVGLCIV